MVIGSLVRQEARARMTLIQEESLKLNACCNLQSTGVFCIAPSESVERVKGGGRDREKNGGDEHFGK